MRGVENAGSQRNPRFKRAEVTCTKSSQLAMHFSIWPIVTWLPWLLGATSVFGCLKHGSKDLLVGSRVVREGFWNSGDVLI